jgi:hypothetical protein
MIAPLMVLALAAAPPPTTPIEPGYWEATDRVLSPIQSTKVERRCIAAKDVAKFMSCYINHHYRCDCPDSAYDDGRIRFRGVCVDNKGARVGIEGDGAYTRTTLHMNARVSFKLAGLPIIGRASTDARRIGDTCPAPAPKPPAAPAPAP